MTMLLGIKLDIQAAFFLVSISNEKQAPLLHYVFFSLYHNRILANDSGFKSLEFQSLRFCCFLYDLQALIIFHFQRMSEFVAQKYVEGVFFLNQILCNFLLVSIYKLLEVF